MKKVNYLLIGILFIAFQSVHAQTAAKNQPILIADPVTHCTYRYHYYPNLEAYFDAKTNTYIYSQNGQWIVAKEIPSGYRGYSLNNKINVVISDYDDDNVTQFIKTHKKKYPYNFHQKMRQVTYNN